MLASLTGKPKYYGEPGWERVPTATNRKDVKLDAMDKQVLEMIRLGHCYMSDLTDALGVDSKTSGASIENLDQGGYIVRAGMRGSKFYTFSITEKGLAALSALSDTEAAMAKEGLSPPVRGAAEDRGPDPGEAGRVPAEERHQVHAHVLHLLPPDPSGLHH